MVFLKKAGERLTTGLLKENVCKYRQNGDFAIRNLFCGGMVVCMNCQMFSLIPAVAFTLIHLVTDPNVSGIVHPAVSATLLLMKTSASIPGSMP